MENEKRLIDANGFERYLEEIFDKKIVPEPLLPTSLMRDFYDFVFRKMKDVPTVDAVEVVRCKDCNHWNDYSCSLGTGDCHVFERLTFETHFCSYGERKGNETK